ncbi:MAG: hypothetical protein AAF911_13855 [Planctomycetota bacterium]
MSVFAQHSKRRAGVASFFAVAALGLVATAALAMVTMLRLDHQRTQTADVDAQLRQLLIAGAAAAESDLETRGPITTGKTLDCPAPLADLGAVVRWQPTEEDNRSQPAGGDDIFITVIAELGEASAYQRLRFVPDESAGGVRLVAASYHP